jgi:hypothetical protein
MVGSANITAREMLENLSMTYVNITDVYLENDFEQMHRAWDPLQPIESLFKQIKDCADYSKEFWFANFFCNLELHERLSQVE